MQVRGPVGSQELGQRTCKNYAIRVKGLGLRGLISFARSAIPQGFLHDSQRILGRD